MVLGGLDCNRNDDDDDDDHEEQGKKGFRENRGVWVCERKKGGAIEIA